MLARLAECAKANNNRKGKDAEDAGGLNFAGSNPVPFLIFLLPDKDFLRLIRKKGKQNDSKTSHTINYPKSRFTCS